MDGLSIKAVEFGLWRKWMQNWKTQHVCIKPIYRKKKSVVFLLYGRLIMISQETIQLRKGIGNGQFK